MIFVHWTKWCFSVKVLVASEHKKRRDQNFIIDSFNTLSTEETCDESRKIRLSPFIQCQVEQPGSNRVNASNYNALEQRQQDFIPKRQKGYFKRRLCWNILCVALLALSFFQFIISDVKTIRQIILEDDNEIRLREKMGTIFNDDDIDDWFDSFRWWNELRPYNDRIHSEPTGPGIYPFEVCHYVEDVCRVDGIDAWVYDPNKVHGDYQTVGPKPLVRLHENRYVDINYFTGGGDSSFREQKWNVELFKPLSQPPTCSYLPITNHFVIMGLYTGMLGEFIERMYSRLVELVHFMITPGPLCMKPFRPTTWDSKQSWITMEERQERMVNKHQLVDECTKDGVSSLPIKFIATTLTAKAKMDSFRKTSRFYLTGLNNTYKEILESHHAYLGLLSDHDLHSSTALSDSKAMQKLIHNHNHQKEEEAEGDKCTCVKRLFFCGFEDAESSEGIQTRQESTQSSMTYPVLDVKKGGSIKGLYNSDVVRGFTREQLYRQSSKLDRLTREYLIGKKETLIQGSNDQENTNKSKDQKDAKYPNFGYTNRTEVQSTETGQKNLRRSLNEANDVWNIAYVEDNDLVNDWRFVGLAQRSDRRKWLNHGDAMEACRDRFTNPRDKIMCIEIDVGSEEFRNKPDLHIAAHAALSGLIGIHGAQLGEALFMPTGALVAEFLPFVAHDPGWGEWTRFVDKPTPIGKMFENTDLNHIGLPLTASSLMHIPCVASARETCDKAKMLECLVGYPRRPSLEWDNRDFTVPVDAVMDMIEIFVASDFNPTNEPYRRLNQRFPLSGTQSSQQGSKHCEDFVETADDKFVLYNLHCTKVSDPSDDKSAHHFYRPKEWIENKTHALLDLPCPSWDL